jgi:hypothetical protein
MPDKKTGRDIPLAPTSMPQAIDNTYVQKRNYAQEAAAPHEKMSKAALKVYNAEYKDAIYNTKKGYFQDKKIENSNLYRLDGLKERKIADSLRKQK